MRRALPFVAVAFVLACSGLVARALVAGTEKHEDNEQKIQFAQLPAAVQKCLTEEAKGAKVDVVDKETEDGKTTYEADVTINGKNYEIKIAEDGTLISKKLDVEDEKDEKDEKEHDSKK